MLISPFFSSLPHYIYIYPPQHTLQSTLINLLQGKLDPQVGYIRVNPQLRVGIFTQHHMDSFDLSLSPIQNMALRWPLVNEVRRWCVWEKFTKLERPVLFV